MGRKLEQRKPEQRKPEQRKPVEKPDRWDAFAIVAPGLAPLVAAELTAMGITPREVSPAGVAFDATRADLLAANLWSRIASRVIVRLDSFEARDFATLEKLAQRVPWTRVMAEGATVSLRVTCRKSKLYHSDAVAERVARGITRSVKGVKIVRTGDDEIDSETADSDTESASTDKGSSDVQRIIVRFDHDRCTISADSSGELLHRRGWRQAVAKAPLRETLAAAMIAACEWNGEIPLVDPFCGSGTIGIEAVLRARNIAPGLSRAFAMERWPGTEAAMVQGARDIARAAGRPGNGVAVVMSDRDEGAVRAARANAERAGVLGDLTIECHSLSDTVLPDIGSTGLVLTNPPYGLRVSDALDLRGLYARLGDVVREGGRGWRLGLLVPDRKLAGQVKLPMEPVLRTTNGGIPVAVELTKAAKSPTREKSPPARSSPSP
ncbi:MAG: class I SAM-dependent RNA methyltransferase [Gemmatimonadota bacterium]